MRKLLAFVVVLSPLGCGDAQSGAAHDLAPPPHADLAGLPTGGGDLALLGDLAPTPTPTPAPADGWLSTRGNHLYTSDGKIWHARGADLQDTRGCNACTFGPPSVAEVERRIDLLVDGWHANFIRLTLESYASADGRTQWQGVLDDAAYLGDVTTIVKYIEAKGAYVLLSEWVDPTFSAEGWPTTQTADEWKKLAATFANEPHVLYGLCNEPQNNFDGSEDAMVWDAMNSTAATIRAVEDSLGAHHHVISVQGTGGWARYLSYYVTHPITAGGGDNYAYEVHVYDPQSTFADRFVTPGKTIPVIIGEFGPVSGNGTTMSMDDCTQLMVQAEALEIPWLGWTFHMRCDPSMLVDNSSGGCGIGMDLQPTAWGTLVKNRLAMPF